MATTVFDCARVPGENCSLRVTGDKADVVAAAKQHLVAAHGRQDDEALDTNVNKAVDEAPIPYASWV